MDGGVDLPAHSRLRDWRDVTVPELYLFFAMLILMSTDVRSKFSEYWTTGFSLIIRFLRFVDNDTISTDSPNNLLAKVKPLLNIILLENKKLFSGT